MGTLWINDAPLDVPGLRLVSFHDDPALELTPEDERPRGDADPAEPHAIVVHTSQGYPDPQHPAAQVVRDGAGPPGNYGRRLSDVERGDGRHAGQHFSIDFDGATYQHADPVRTVAYHAGVVNRHAVGIEIRQGTDASLWTASFAACVLLCDALTAALPIPRQFCAGPGPYPLRRLAAMNDGGDGRAGADAYGLYAHFHQTSERSPGDPGEAVWRWFLGACYMPLDFAVDADRAFWRPLQELAGVKADGCPGRASRAAFAAKFGWRAGQFIHRPIDATLAMP